MPDGVLRVEVEKHRDVWRRLDSLARSPIFDRYVAYRLLISRQPPGIPLHQRTRGCGLLTTGLREWSEQAKRIRARYFSDVVFVHINKTGGSSIEAALKLPFQHKTALELKRELGERRWNRRFSFAFVRNPWDKVASHYKYRVQTNQTGLGTNPIPFNEWVRIAYGANDPRYYDQPKMFMPQVDWIADEQGEIMVDMVGRYENLAHDFARVCENIGRHAELPHLKKSSNRNFRQLYEPDTIEIVRRWFDKDIRAFNYSFE